MSSPAEDPPPSRDPLLDDPAFAELVEPPKPAAPVFAEPIEVPVESLPVAEVVRPKAVPIPVVPKAATKIAPNISMPVPVETEPPRPQWFAACGVIGCFGVLLLGAIAALIWIAISLLSGLGDKIGELNTKPPGKEAADVVPRGPLAPTVLAGDVDIPLAGRVDAVAHGGGGRFLLMRCGTSRQIQVFDANQAQIVYTIPISESGALFTAGSEKIFVCEPVGKSLKSYGLYSGKLEATESLSDVPRVQALVLGSDSTGPVRAVAAASKKLRIHDIDATSLKPLSISDFAHKMDETSHVLARASDNNSVLGVSTADGAVAVWYGTGKPTSKRLFAASPAPAWALPSPGGQYFYTPRGVFDTSGSSMLGTRTGLYTFPAAHGNDWFLSLDEADDEVSGRPRRHAAGATSIAKAVDLDKVFLADEWPANALEADVTAADRIHWWPSAGLAAVLQRTKAKEAAVLQLFKMTPVVEK
jgi:hypothetical protein